MIRLAGIPFPVTRIIEVAGLLRRYDFADTADVLEAAIATRQPEIALTINDREAILTVLVDPPQGLEILRAVLLQEYVGRKRDGLA